MYINHKTYFPWSLDERREFDVQLTINRLLDEIERKQG